jgi:hypothetical protein
MVERFGPRRRAVLDAAIGTAGALAGLAPVVPLRAAPQVLWRSRFDPDHNGWGRALGWGVENRGWFEEPGVLGQFMRVHLSAGGIDPGTMQRRGLPVSGTGFKGRLLDPAAHEATLQYRLRFAPGFAFVRGGKLPGLYGGIGPSGGRLPNGFDGFSLRLMWRQRGHGEVYAYLPTSQRHGTSLMPGALRFDPGRWHALGVRLNTPGRADGLLRLWQDGRCAGEQGGLRLRDTLALGIEGVFFDVFFGGNDDSWAPPSDIHIDFAEFAITAGIGGAA